MSLSWSSESSAAEPRSSGTGRGSVVSGGGSPPISPASSARSSLSAAEADDDKAPQPVRPPPGGVRSDDDASAAAPEATTLQGAGSARARHHHPPQPSLLRSRTGPPDFLIGVWPPNETGQRSASDSGAPAPPAAGRLTEKKPRGSSETVVAALAGTAAAGGRSKLWHSLADVLGLVPDPPSGFIQPSHWAADDAGHVFVPRASADGSHHPAGDEPAADLRRTRSQGFAGTAAAAAEHATESSAGAAGSPTPVAAAAMSVPEAVSGPCSHTQSSNATSSSLAQTLQRAASAASSLWRGDSKGDSSGGNSPREPPVGPRAQGAAPTDSEARDIPQAAASIPAAPQSRCQCPQHRAKAAAAAAAASTAATATSAEAVSALAAAETGKETAVADGRHGPRAPLSEHLPLSFPVPWMAQRPEPVTAAAEDAEVGMLSVAMVSMHPQMTWSLVWPRPCLRR